MPTTDTEEKVNAEKRNQDRALQGAKFAGFLRKKLHNPVVTMIVIGLISIFCSLIVYFFLG